MDSTTKIEITNPHLLIEIIKRLQKDVKGEARNIGILVLICLSKDIEPQSCIIYSTSSAGKSYIIKKILLHFPDKYKIIASRMTPRVLDRMNEELDGKILFLEEYNTARGKEGEPCAEEILRVLLSEGQTALYTVSKKGDAEKIEVKGKPVFLSCSASAKIGDEMKSRIWLLSLNETQTQTESILDFQDKELMNPSKKEEQMSDIKVIISELPSDCDVLIPFANWKSYKFPTDKVQARRDYKKLNGLIKASAFLHYKNRPVIEIKEQKYILASLYDYYLARWLVKDAFTYLTTGISTLAYDFAVKLQELETEDFNIYETLPLFRNPKMTRPTAYRRLNELCENGFLSVQKEKRTNVYRKTDELFSLFNKGEQVEFDEKTAYETFETWSKNSTCSSVHEVTATYLTEHLSDLKYTLEQVNSSKKTVKEVAKN